jgi:hypothetical protein
MDRVQILYLSHLYYRLPAVIPYVVVGGHFWATMTNEAVKLDGGPRTGDFTATAESRTWDHRFYAGMAFLIAIGVFAGFTPTYYARSYFHSPAIPVWVQIHGAVFTGWMVLYLLQNLLAMNGGMRLHRNLGVVGIILSSSVVFFGSAVTLNAAREGRYFPFPDSYGLLAVSFGQMLLFAVFVSFGLLLRRDGETHKRLMLMAPQLFFFPAFGRLLHGINWLTIFLALSFFLAGPIYDLFRRRRVHTAYRWGVPLLILTMPPFSMMASHNSMFRHFTDSLTGHQMAPVPASMAPPAGHSGYVAR